MFSKEKRVIYQNNQLGEVICQLRFPEILSIETDIPAKFQEEIRDSFPRYQLRREKSAPKVTGVPGNLQMRQEENNNYMFSTDDGMWRVNLTSKFISLSTSSYHNWEEFAAMLDKPLVAFIRTYRPACFDRVGLRYLNFISRSKLDLRDTPFQELIQPPYLGILGIENLAESAVNRCGMDAELAISGGCHLKLHAGPGKVSIGGNQDDEIKFILDLDLFMTTKVPVNYSAGALETLHSQSYSIFRSAITDTLHDAMHPINP